MVSRTPHSIVLASQYTVVEPKRMWGAMHGHRGELIRLGARHVAGYESLSDPCEVLMTIALRTARSVPQVLSSAAVMRWFDIAGVTDIPPILVGSLLDSVRFAASAPMPPPVVVSATALVSDAAALIAEIRRTAGAFAAAGIRRTRVYESVDQPNEVMVIHEIDDEQRGRRLADLPDAALRWASRAGLRIYPALFVGRVMDAFDVQSNSGRQH
jgi:hypothetical protein